MRIQSWLICSVTALIFGASLSGCTIDGSAVRDSAIDNIRYVDPPGYSGGISATEKEAFAYYHSSERAALLQTTLNEVGSDWRGRMLSGEIPSATRGLDSHAPAPATGHGELYSTPSLGDDKEGRDVHVSVTINFAHSKVRSEEPLGLFVSTPEGRVLTMYGPSTDRADSPCSQYDRESRSSVTKVSLLLRVST